MSQKNFQIFRSQISDLKTDNVDYLKKPPWKKFFFDIFVIHLSSRYEKWCRMLQRLFSLFQGSKNQLWYLNVILLFSMPSFFKNMLSFLLSKLFKFLDIFTLCKFFDGPKSFSFFSTESSPEPFPTFIFLDDCDMTTKVGLAEEYPTTIT